uniref:uncharacterized protein LOC120335173 n=1 Tax=Styela clava TaxID=7725 RepID=UPI001939E148|nr:uncharacterized protein LOC120335173 [Styela clava]
MADQCQAQASVSTTTETNISDSHIQEVRAGQINEVHAEKVVKNVTNIDETNITDSHIQEVRAEQIHEVHAEKVMQNVTNIDETNITNSLIQEDRAEQIHEVHAEKVVQNVSNIDETNITDSHIQEVRTEQIHEVHAEKVVQNVTNIEETNITDSHIQEVRAEQIHEVHAEKVVQNVSNIDETNITDSHIQEVRTEQIHEVHAEKVVQNVTNIEDTNITDSHIQEVRAEQIHEVHAETVVQNVSNIDETNITDSHIQEVRTEQIHEVHAERVVQNVTNIEETNITDSHIQEVRAEQIHEVHAETVVQNVSNIDETNITDSHIQEVRTEQIHEVHAEKVVQNVTNIEETNITDSLIQEIRAEQIHEVHAEKVVQNVTNIDETNITDSHIQEVRTEQIHEVHAEKVVQNVTNETVLNSPKEVYVKHKVVNKVYNIFQAHDQPSSSFSSPKQQRPTESVSQPNTAPDPVYKGDPLPPPSGVLDKVSRRINKGQRVKKFIDFFNKRTWEETEVKIAENYKKLNEPDFEVHPKLKKVPNFYEGQMAKEYNKEKGFAVTEGSEKIGQLITMNKLSEQLSDESCKYIAITGQAGSGKTTIMKRVSRSVVVANELVKKARKAKGTVSQLFRKKKRQFRFVHHFGFKDMPVSYATRPEDALSPCDLLFGKIAPGFKNLELEDGYEWLIEHDYECIFFFDGLDQAMWDLHGNHNKMNYFDKSSTATIIYNILTRNLFPRAKIVISSREHKIASLPLELRPPFITALAGLDHEDIKKLFVSVLGETGEESWNNLTVQSPSLIQFSSVPLFLLLNAIVHKFNPANPPDTMTDVMIQILHIFMRSDHAQERGNIKQNIRKLMEMSFEGTKQKRVIFTIDDLKKVGLHSDEVRDLIIKVPGNNMLSQHLMEGDNLMFFSHQILQEILASLYIANMDLATFQLFIAEEIHDDHWSVVLRLLCGIIFNQDIKTEFLKDLTTVFDREAKKALLRESLKNKMSQCTRSYQKLELFGALYEANDAELIQSHVRGINFEDESFNAAGMYAMSSVMRRCGHLEQFRLVKCDLNAELMKCLDLSLKGSGVKVSKIDISGNQMNEEAFKSLGSALASIDGKEMELKLQMCGLTKEKIDALGRNTELKIHTLDVRNNSKITSDLFLAIAKVATQNEVKNLLTDPCEELRLTTEQLMELSKWKTCGKIHTLDVRNNSKITSDLFLAIAKVATQSEVKNLLTDPCGMLRLTTEQLMKLSKWKTCGKIHTLDVQNTSKITSDLFLAIAEVATRSEVKNLLTDPCEELHLTTKQLMELSKRKTYGKICTLDVRNNSKITFDLFLAIAKVATQSEVENLLTDPCEELHLTTKQLMELNKWETCAKIHTLDVRNNSKITSDLFLAIAKVATQSEAKNLLTDPCKELRLTTKQLMELSEWKTCGKIHTLDVRNNSKITFNLFLTIAKVATRSEVKKLLADPCEELRLNKKQLVELSKWRTCGKLDKLVVSHNKDLGAAGFREVGLVVTQCQVKALEARDCNLTAEGMKTFKENTHNAKLDKLDVSGNKYLGTAGFGEVGSVVTQCRVKALEAWFCNLAAEEMKAFKENSRNAKLDKLDVSYNKYLGTAGFGEVGLVVTQCQVKSFVAMDCHLTAERMKAFEENTRNAKLDKLDVSYNKDIGTAGFGEVGSVVITMSGESI